VAVGGELASTKAEITVSGQLLTIRIGPLVWGVPGGLAVVPQIPPSVVYVAFPHAIINLLQTERTIKRLIIKLIRTT
jgi:hypothetical protein